MRSRPIAGGALLAALAAVLLVALVPSGLAHAVRTPAASTALSPTSDYVNVSATSSYSFQPAVFYVYPGATVHLAVTQLADFAHTFTLSSVRNATIPSSDNASQLYHYFQANPPILNLSLAGTVGFVNSTTFVAPAVGSYEFVCTEPGHFQLGMKGAMNSVTSIPSSSSSGLPVTTYVVVGGIVGAIVIVLAVALVVRARRSRGAPPPS